jgi:hypothetical protein
VMRLVCNQGRGEQVAPQGGPDLEEVSGAALASQIPD